MQVSCWLSTLHTTSSMHMLIACNLAHHIDLDFSGLPIVHNFLLVVSLVCHISTLTFIVGCSTHCNDLDFYRLPIVHNLKCLHIKNISILIISISNLINFDNLIIIHFSESYLAKLHKTFKSFPSTQRLFHNTEITLPEL